MNHNGFSHSGELMKIWNSAASASVVSLPIEKFVLWKKIKNRRRLLTVELELTARCNNNCRHCCINLSAGDSRAKKAELTFDEIKKIVDEAASLGTLWFLLTGGEPLLREDFLDIYLLLKRKGFLISIFTNANLIAREHVELFKKYPPRDIEITVYGVTQETYERVTRKPGSFASFKRGLGLLSDGDLKVALKAVALRSNAEELPGIFRFCREKTKDYFRFDPFLELRYDGDAVRNREIKSERLSPEEIVALEHSDPQRYGLLKKKCDELIIPELAHRTCNHLFHCGAGNGSASISSEGIFRLCGSLWHPDCVCDLRQGSLSEAWASFVPRVREIRSDNPDFLKKCRVCAIRNLCMWCPGRAHLETGELDRWVDYFCEVAHSRKEALLENGIKQNEPKMS